MNYYDEEITVSGPSTQKLSQIKVERLPSGRGRGGAAAAFAGMENTNRTTTIAGGRSSGSSRLSHADASAGSRGRAARVGAKTKLKSGAINDDDGLLQDIIDHDDGDDDDDDDDDVDEADTDDDSDVPNTSNYHTTTTTTTKSSANPPLRRSATQRVQTRPLSKTQKQKKSLNNDTEPSDTESDEAPGLRHNLTDALSDYTPAVNETKFNITPEKWESLNVHQEIKDIFPYILKYTPQTISIPYRLQPFIPDYVPAIGDVDAFIKVTPPTLLQPERQTEIDEHIAKLGLYVLDEPSGEQSVPSLLSMKLRSVLTGRGMNPRSASAAQIPTVKSSKDVDKWIVEVEQVHMANTTNDAQLRCDVDALLIEWPREFADGNLAIQDAYQRSIKDELGLDGYVRLLSERFGIKGPLDTQADYLLSVQTIFALYLMANQAWE